MSEMPVFKRPLESNSSNEPPNKPTKSVRIKIDLSQINKDGSVVLNYNKLLNEERHRLEKQARGENNDSQTSEKENKRMKFNDTRYHSYAELGAGYDDDDSFIDNTEAYEEGLPENMDTKYGGYYINSGQLELKKSNKPGNSSDSSSEETSDSSESDDSSEDEIGKRPVVKKEATVQHDSSDSKKLYSDSESRKKPKVIYVPQKEKLNSEIYNSEKNDCGVRRWV